MMNDKIAFVSGASRGVGVDIAKRLAVDGYSVAIGYASNAEKAENVRKQIVEDGGKAIIVEFDYRYRKSITDALNSVKKYFNKPVQILVNNGAIAQEKPFETITDEDWQLMMKINLQGPFIACQEVVNDMKKEGFGRIVNITSIGGQWGGFNQVHYAAAKAGLINFTRSMAKLYSENNILTNAIAIGLVETDMSSAELARDDGKTKVAGIPIGRIGRKTDVAGAVSFLISEQASYITGQTINLNGGMYFD